MGAVITVLIAFLIRRLLRYLKECRQNFLSKKGIENGTTVINVNIVNLTFSDYVATGLGTPGYYKELPLNASLYKSTGVFERLITDLIK